MKKQYKMECSRYLSERKAYNYIAKSILLNQEVDLKNVSDLIGYDLNKKYLNKTYKVVVDKGNIYICLDGVLSSFGGSGIFKFQKLIFINEQGYVIIKPNNDKTKLVLRLEDGKFNSLRCNNEYTRHSESIKINNYLRIM